MKICGTIQKFRNQIFYIDKFRNRNYNKRVRKITTQSPSELVRPRPADRRKEIRDIKLVRMKPHRLVVRLPDGRSGGTR